MSATLPNPSPRPHRWRRWLKGLGLVALLLVATVAGRCLYAFRDRNPGYTVAIDIDGSRARTEPRPLRVGFGRLKITPDVKDPARPVWLAGFSQNRAATGVHDDLWAIAMVLDDGHTRLAVVSLDAIGFFHDDVIAVRRRVASLLQPAPDYTVVCSTHNHSTPDLMGLWGRDYLHSGVLPEYREFVIRQAAEAVAAAVSNLQPARLVLHEIPTPPDGLVIDTRPPQVFDADLRVPICAVYIWSMLAEKEITGTLKPDERTVLVQ